LFWGALAYLLYYQAFNGAIIVAIMILSGALLDATSILAALWPAAAYYVLHLIEGNAVTPVFVGNRLTISPFLVFIAFIFWLWLWGPVGAVLSTPIVIVAMVAQEEFARYRREKAKEEAEEAGEAEAA
jgi:predicted PurR-regulated permease PerM